jgi:hypothetical protein
VAVVGCGCSVFGGGRLGSATKAQKPKIAVRAWVGADVHGCKAAEAPKVYMAVVGGRHARVPKIGRVGGGMVVAGP